MTVPCNMLAPHKTAANRVSPSRRTIMRCAALLLTATCTSASILPAANAYGSNLVAYYALNDGTGFDLRESVSNTPNAGRVLYEDEHQTVNYTQPNWVEDEYFGMVISCGDKETEPTIVLTPS